MVRKPDGHSQDVLGGFRVAYDRQLNVLVTERLRAFTALVLLRHHLFQQHGMLIGRLVFVVRGTPKGVPGEELLETLILAALSLAIHELGRPGPCNAKADVAPQ